MAEVDLSELLTDGRLEAGKSPVDPDNSSDYRDTLEFEELETEFRKGETDGPTAVNWRDLNAKTVDVIANKSKDLVLATRLVYGLFLDEGYSGLAVGISILRDLIESHWEDLIPPVKRERGRVGSLDWMAEKVAVSIDLRKPTPDVVNFALVAHDRLVEIDEMLDTKLQKVAVALGPLIRALRPYAAEARQALEQVSAPTPEPQAATPEVQSVQSTNYGQAPVASVPQAPVAAEEPHTPASPSAPDQNAIPAPVTPLVPAPAPAPVLAPTPTAPAQVSAPAVEVPELKLSDGVDEALSAFCASLARIATHMRGEALKDPRTYLTARFAAWGKIKAAPSAVGGKTMLPPPQKAKLTEIEALAKAGNHEGLVRSMEGTMLTSPYWLDCQYFVATSLADLGSDYAVAKAVVEAETAAFVKRLPQVIDFTFSDGMPFASPETKNWLASLASSGGDGATGGVDPVLADARSAAAKLAQSGQVPAGLKILTEYANSRTGGRETFLARLEIGEFCLRFDNLLPLFAMLDGMNEKERNLGLIEWDPQLATALASLNVRALNHKNAKQIIAEPEIRERKTSALRMLSQLDIALASELAATPTG
ncbi:type VI secretion system protein TssA [uncultured Cohaesibacter sp.]|uniref:type VI secretion system protein TssA n=1 Tax=uncultured Cohaesibacter sp. TaxID=1002546 RepID=UPI0029C84D37|nr:type VI secretion system protein TssA [uncultured Cohaesibacter sp.]